MKNLAILIFSLFVLGKAHAQTTDSTIRLPLTFKPGFGPFQPSYGAVGWDSSDPQNEWYKTYLPIKGIPADWTDVKKGMILFDLHQFAYQNYIAGNMADSDYRGLQTSWNWIPDTTKLSKKPLICFVYVVSGKNKDGKRMLIIDTQGDLDVSNDVPFVPGNFDSPMTSQPTENIHMVSHQKVEGGKLVNVISPVLLLCDSVYVWSCIPQYGVAKITSGSKTYQINVASTLTSDDMLDASVTLFEQKDGKLLNFITDSIVNRGEYLAVGNKIYNNQGVVDNMLNLQPVTDTAHMYSTQIGYKALPFNGKQFDTGKEVSLSGLKGKYVFVDFWGTWCAPCRGELPYLKKTYDMADKSKVAFIGVVNDDTYESLKPVLDKEGITWPHILSGGDNNIALHYNINVYPSNFLIDPQGRIIAKNLRGNALAAKLKELQITLVQ